MLYRLFRGVVIMENQGRTLTETGLITNVGLETTIRSSGLEINRSISWQRLETWCSGWSLRPGMEGQPGQSTTHSGQIYAYKRELSILHVSNSCIQIHFDILTIDKTSRVREEDQGYQLDIGGHRGGGGAGDSLTGVNGMKFSTRDRDNDIHPSVNCAQHFKGGWWFSQ